MNFNCRDFTDGYYKLNRYLFMENAYDHERGGVTAHKFDVTMRADSCACELNLHDLNYTMNKWRMLNNLYYDPQEIGVMIARIKHYKEQKKHSKYIPDIAYQFKQRHNVSGACLLSLVLGYHNGSWVCNVVSRASELTCRWPMDLIFVHVMLKTIGGALGIGYLDIKIIWKMISTYQSITSMPYFLVLSGDEEYLENFNPDDHDPKSWQYYTWKRYLKCYKGDAYTSFGTQRRPMEAYRMLKGLMPRKGLVYTSDLTLQVVPFCGNLEEDYDEVDTLCVNSTMLNELAQEAKDNDEFGKGGYR